MNKKISELDAISVVDNADVLPIVDATDTVTKKVSIEQIAEAAPVQSVNGEIGDVVLDKSDIGLGDVDNTSDADKPISSATQTALNGKQDVLAYTPEDVANKSTSVTTDQASNTKYPSVKAVYDWAVGLFATIAQLATKQDTLVSGTNIKTINSTSLLGTGDISIQANPSGGAGAIQFSNGSAFASDSNLFWDNTNKRLGVGTNAPSGSVEIQGVGNTNADKILIVKNLAGTTIFEANGSSTSTGVIAASARLANINFFSGNVIDSASLRIVGSSTGIALNQDYSSPAASTQVHIKGSGSTLATTALLVQNSSGNNALQVIDDLRVIVPSVFETGATNGFVFSSNSIRAKIDGFLALDRTNNREFRITDINFTRNYLILASSNSSNFADISFNTSHLAIKKEGNIGIGTSTPNASSILDVTSTTQGFLPPRMTTTQKNAISSPAAGLVVYDNTTNKLCCYDGSTWNDLF